MSGITPIDRRDLERMLKAAVHAENRDVEVKVIFCVQYSFLGDADAVQTLVDPWQPFPRRSGLALTKAAIEALDKRGRGGVSGVLAQGVSGTQREGTSQEVLSEPDELRMEAEGGPSQPDSGLVSDHVMEHAVGEVPPAII